MTDFVLGEFAPACALYLPPRPVAVGAVEVSGPQRVVDSAPRLSLATQSYRLRTSRGSRQRAG